MSGPLFRLMQRRQAKSRQATLLLEPSRVRIVHYSCESFRDRTDATSPRVTSIAVRDWESGQTESFSLHLVAEREGKTHPTDPAILDSLERTLLKEFFSFVHQHQKARWVHWNMRNVNYGFAALEHRARVLGIPPEEIDESRRFDLADHLVTLFGRRLAKHPRLDSLRELNKISKKDFLTGAEEAAAFEAGQFYRLHQSTLRKVDVIHHLLSRLAEDRLVTDASWWDRNGGSILGSMERLTDTWLYKVLGFLAILATLAGFFLCF